MLTKSVITILILCFCPAGHVWGQSESDEFVRVGMKANTMMFSRDFSAVSPETRKGCHARGTIRIWVKVDKNGNIDDATTLTKLCERLMEEVLGAVRSWTFRQYLVDGDPVKFKGIILIKYYYGGLD